MRDWTAVLPAESRTDTSTRYVAPFANAVVKVVEVAAPAADRYSSAVPVADRSVEYHTACAVPSGSAYVHVTVSADVVHGDPTTGDVIVTTGGDDSATSAVADHGDGSVWVPHVRTCHSSDAPLDQVPPVTVRDDVDDVTTPSDTHEPPLRRYWTSYLR